MAKSLNKGYVGRKMSKGAYKAIQFGEVPLSIMTATKLKKSGVLHSISFVKWLCKLGYIKPTSWHHRGNPPILTRFYHPRSIAKQMSRIPVDALLEEWMATWKGRKHSW